MAPATTLNKENQILYIFGGSGPKGLKKEIWAFHIEDQVWEYKKLKG